MRSTAEIPHHGGPFDDPIIPNTIVAQIALLEEGHVQIVETVLLNITHRLLAIRLPEGQKQIREHLAHEILLISTQLSHGDTIKAFLEPRDLHGAIPSLTATLRTQRKRTLFAIERLEDLIGALGLIPIDIARMVRGFIEGLGGVTVEDGASKDSAALGIPITPAGAVATREREAELARARFSEQGDARRAKAAVSLVVLIKLLPDLFFVFFTVQLVEDLSHHRLLILVENLIDALGRDVPVVIDFCAKLIFPWEAEDGALLFIEGFVECRDQGIRVIQRGSRLGCEKITAKERSTCGGEALHDELAA